LYLKWLQHRLDREISSTNGKGKAGAFLAKIFKEIKCLVFNP